MNPQKPVPLKEATQNLERSLEILEGILETGNNRPLYLATLALVEALRQLHQADASLLAPASVERVEELIRKDKPRGRDSFNTGF